MRTFTRLLALVALPPVVAALTAATAAAGPNHLAPLVAPTASATVLPIDGTYLVQVRPGKDVRGVARAADVTPTHVFDAAVTGFSAKLTPGQLRELRRDPAVTLIEQDAVVTDALDATQFNPPWGLDRIDQRNRPLSNSFTYNSNGSRAHAYIIDTGIFPGHPDFGGRATFDFNAIDANNTDCHGHGTHVAGTVGSNTYGVAKGVRLHGVKMMNCYGSTTTTAAVNAINWVTANAQRPAVANTSWNYSASTTLETAIRNMIRSGVFLATSGGNTAGNSCDRLPRKVLEAVAVASSDINDVRSSFSSTGSCIDVYAPGSSILSTLRTGGAGTMSGTSMASPHVAGVAALYRSLNPNATVATVHNWIVANATPNVISGGGTGGTANRLLYTAGL